MNSSSRSVLLLLFLLLAAIVRAQDAEKIEVPKGIVYKYCDEATYSQAKQLITESLKRNDDYSLMDKIMIVGPVLWNRFQKIKELKSIEGGNTTLLVDDKKLSAKLTQDVNDSRKVWNEVRKEINGESFVLRKATPDELKYYWSVISFDIEEPLIIVETKKANYLLNLNPKTLKVLWLDQTP